VDLAAVERIGAVQASEFRPRALAEARQQRSEGIEPSCVTSKYEASVQTRSDWIVAAPDARRVGGATGRRRTLDRGAADRKRRRKAPSAACATAHVTACAYDRRMSILWLRHGETALNAARVLQPAATPLSERGHAQAAAAARRLAALRPVALLSSESRAEFFARVAAAWFAVRALRQVCGGPLVVVSHGLVIHAALARHAQWDDPALVLPPRLANTSLSVVEDAPPHRVRMVDDISHLSDAIGADAQALSGG
jgi:hypothetical protein